jgi:hypothetical protein
MLKWLLRSRIDAYEKEWDYDMGYARELLAADPSALLAFSKVVGLAQYRKDVPRDPWFASKLAATLAEDCGPCTQLVVTMAERAGMQSEVLRAILEGDVASMPDDVALAFRFAQAAIAHDPEADVFREEVVKRWGAKGLVSLAFAVTSARLFPTLKYALGHGRTCARVNVAGKAVAVNHARTA